MEDTRAIFLALIARLPVRFAFFRLRSPIRILIFAWKNVYFWFMSPIHKTTTSITLANSWKFQILLQTCIKNVICKMHCLYFLLLCCISFSYFCKNVPPACPQSRFFETYNEQSTSKNIFLWSFECPKWRINGPSFWHLSLFCPFGSPFFGSSRPS